MDVEIRNWASPENRPLWENIRCSLSPDGKWAAAELFHGELFVVGRVLRRTEQKLVLDFLEAVPGFRADGTDICRQEVQWECLRWGFLKLVCRGIESCECRVRRVYVDRALYEASRNRRRKARS